MMSQNKINNIIGLFVSSYFFHLMFVIPEARNVETLNDIVLER